MNEIRDRAGNPLTLHSVVWFDDGCGGSWQGEVVGWLVNGTFPKGAVILWCAAAGHEYIRAGNRVTRRAG